MNIHDWPSGERPREKLLSYGAGILSDAELLAIFLGSGKRGQDAVQTARELLLKLGGLRNILELSPQELAGLSGIGPVTACRLVAAVELNQRYLAASLKRGVVLSDPNSAGRYFAQRLRAYRQETFAVLFLDTRHRALAFEELFKGTIDSAQVHPREVICRALHHNAAAVMLGHNHPSGNPEPSLADRAITSRLRDALGLVDIRLLDHFIIGDGKPVSLAERGWV